MILPIENLYDVLILLAIPLPMAAGIAIGLVALIFLLTKGLRPLPRKLARAVGSVAGGICALVNVSTSALWWWSWRYFESPTGTPPRVEEAIDLGIVSGGIGLIVSVCIAGVAPLLRAVDSSRIR